MIQIAEAHPFQTPPRWAVLQRTLFATMDRARRRFSEVYGDEHGGLRFTGALDPSFRDGVDDFYESLFNWPHLYLLGGSAETLEAAKRHWAGITRQLTAHGMLSREFDRGYDWFHQGESLVLLYGICLADPGDPRFRERLIRYARIMFDPRFGNFDADRNIFRAPHVGADGARPGFLDRPPVFPWDRSLRPYGIPLPWATDAHDFDELLGRPQEQLRLGRAMWERMGTGDTVVNLAATSLAVLASMLESRTELATAGLDYAAGWLSRIDTAGRLPDNVAPDGKVGGLMGGRWYGGHYGWSWPHGLHSVGTAAVIAAINGISAGRPELLELGRRALDMALEGAEYRRPGAQEMSGAGRWSHLSADWWKQASWLVPQRVGDRGWFDFQPVQMALPVALWQATGSAADLARVHDSTMTRKLDPTFHKMRDKEEAGHEEAWMAFLEGSNPEYPIAGAQAVLSLVQERVEDIERDGDGYISDDFNLWQRRNPVLTEFLTQLTGGAPQVLYNGGLPSYRVRYHDLARRRPGLPSDVAALVTEVSSEHIRLTLANLGSDPRRILLQAGTFGEHRFDSVEAGRRRTVGAPYLVAELPPGTELTCELAMTLHCGRPTAFTDYASFMPRTDTEDLSL